MPDVSNIPHFNLKVILLTHFLFLSLSTLSPWAPTGYLIYNFGFIACLLWSVMRPESLEAVQFAFVLNVVSIVMDIIAITLWYPSSAFTGSRFAIAFAILHVIVRPFSTIYLMQVVNTRTGSGGLMANVYPTGRSSSYEDIDRSPASAPAPAASYDFSSAQQI